MNEESVGSHELVDNQMGKRDMSSKQLNDLKNKIIPFLSDDQSENISIDKKKVLSMFKNLSQSKIDEIH